MQMLGASKWTFLVVQAGLASSREMCEKKFAVLGELLRQMCVGGLASATHHKRLQTPGGRECLPWERELGDRSQGHNLEV